MIPKIIHQIWDGCRTPLPDFYKQLSDTWKEYHSDWRYEFWNGNKMEVFVEDNYPHLKNVYSNFKYNIQRWDVIRYLILYKMGGMYVDFDYECLNSFDDYVVEEGKCYFAMEPDEHRLAFGKDIYFNNALMITPLAHPFFEHIITHLQMSSVIYSDSKFLDVLTSTGPLMLTNLYEKYKYKSRIDFLSPEEVSPWSQREVRNYINGNANVEILDKKLKKAIAIHYFWGSW